MMISQASFSVDHYVRLLNLAYESANSLKGKKSPMPWLPHCQQLAAKLVFHSATIYWLRQGTKAPKLDESSSEYFFYDLASVTVLARSALETYLTLFEVFLEPTSEDELTFRHGVWLLSGFVIREKPASQRGSSEPEIARMRLELGQIRDRIRATKTFAQLSLDFAP